MSCTAHFVQLSFMFFGAGPPQLALSHCSQPGGRASWGQPQPIDKHHALLWGQKRVEAMQEVSPYMGDRIRPGEGIHGQPQPKDINPQVRIRHREGPASGEAGWREQCTCSVFGRLFLHQKCVSVECFCQKYYVIGTILSHHLNLSFKLDIFKITGLEQLVEGSSQTDLYVVLQRYSR